MAEVSRDEMTLVRFKGEAFASSINISLSKWDPAIGLLQYKIHVSEYSDPVRPFVNMPRTCDIFRSIVWPICTQCTQVYVPELRIHVALNV